MTSKTMIALVLGAAGFAAHAQYVDSYYPRKDSYYDHDHRDYDRRDISPLRDRAYDRDEVIEDPQVKIQKKQVINVQNTAVAQPNVYVQQPITTVQATPLIDSAAEIARKEREHAEIHTEQKIAVKLEQSRLDDEKRRAERLFGDNFGGKYDKDKDYDRHDHDYDKRDYDRKDYGYDRPYDLRDKDYRGDRFEPIHEIHEEKRAARIEAIKEKYDDEYDDRDYYMILSIGKPDYSSVKNVQGNLAAGISLGYETLYYKRVSVEAQFLYSNYYVSDYWLLPFFKDMDQYSLGASVKYTFLPRARRFNPYLGGIAAYTYRNYHDRDYYGYSYPGDSSINSNSVDLGVAIGIDFLVDEGVSVGGDLRYMYNLASWSNSRFISSSDYLAPGNGTPIERLSYYVASLTCKFHF